MAPASIKPCHNKQLKDLRICMLHHAADMTRLVAYIAHQPVNSEFAACR